MAFGVIRDLVNMAWMSAMITLVVSFDPKLNRAIASFLALQLYFISGLFFCPSRNGHVPFCNVVPLVYFWLCQQLTHKNDPTKKEAANLSTSLQAAPHLVLVKTRPHKEDTHTHMMCAQGNGEMHSIKSL